MHRAIVLLLAAALSVALAVAAACNPIFGIVSRTAGPTWCEEKAQAGNAYCDDFDRVSATTTRFVSAQLVRGTLQITDAASHSPPNSLEVSSFELEAGSHASALIGNIVSLGEMPGFPPFRCSVDVRPGEIVEAGRETRVGVVAVGGLSASGRPAPALVFVSFGPPDDAGYKASAMLATVNSANAAADPMGTPCPLEGIYENVNQDWATLQVSLASTTLLGGLVEAGTIPKLSSLCMVGPGTKRGGGHADASADASLPEAGADATAEGGRPPLIMLVQFGLGSSAVLVPADFFGQPYFAYGISIRGASRGVTLHFDNATCMLTDGGLPGP